MTATGGELVVGFVNSLMWDFWGSDSDVFTSAIDFSLVQPLLRFGGRARVLENLTQSERNLLANVRQFRQFQQGFYVNVITGRDGGPGPTLGDTVGSPGLGLIARTPSGRSGAASAGGFLGLLEDQQEIRNQASNIAALRDSLAQLEAAFDANRISSRLQVDQARQALLNAQSSLLTSKAAYQTQLDSFKLQLGLPPELPVTIEDPLLDRFILIDPALTELQNEVEQVLSSLRQMRDAPIPETLDEIDQRIEKLSARINGQHDSARTEMTRLDEIVPKRRAQLERVRDRIDDLDADVDRRVYDVAAMETRVEDLKTRVPEIGKKLSAIFAANGAEIDERPNWLQPRRASRPTESNSDTPETEEALGTLIEAEPERLKSRWKATLLLATELSDTLLELSLVQAEIRLQGISLKPSEIDPETALDYARVNRLDWMNARANLVDSWRRIEFFANALRSDLDVVVDGQLGTNPDNIFEFDHDRSRLRFGVRFDTPITRLVERNAYRRALINYQRARRDYMLFEDRVQQSIRNTLRIITLSEINLEVRRAAVQVAIAQVDIARLKLNPPVRPNQPTRTSPTAARDLVSALTDLLDAQNDFLNVWVANEVLRVLLDFEMGTMQLDPMGVWIDAGIAGESDSPAVDEFSADLQTLPSDPQNPSELDLRGLKPAGLSE
ncbi:MAG: TolC family protein [Planctomycetota bacterium]